MQIRELYQSVTDTIVKDLENGVASWVKPWKSNAGGIMPFNAASKRSYSGINIPILWDAAIRGGYSTQGWLTYKQAKEIGAQVRGGEKSTSVVFTRKVLVREEDEERSVQMLKVFSVFNVSQIDGLPEEKQPPKLSQEERDDAATRFITATKADIRHGGDRAYYSPSLDYIALPHTLAFESYEHYLATCLHELCHWSGHKTRLDRDLKPRFDTKAYAAEELVAELGAAFLCAHLEVQGQLRHSEYIANWLQLLRDDPRAIFTAASKASQAAEYLRSITEERQEAA